jgi:hypothetical protein
MATLQTVEVRFWGERLADVMLDEGIFTLYRTHRGSYLAVADQDEGLPWLRAVDEARIRALWPELLEAAGLL